MANKTRIRRYAAIAFGIVGVSGLSLASAAQLNVSTDEIAVGSATFAACDSDGINVGYTTGTATGSALPVSTIVVGSGSDAAALIDAACAGRDYTLLVLDSAGAPISGQTYTGTVVAGTTNVTATGLDASAVYGVQLVIE